MKIIKRILGNIDKLTIIPISDVHLGEPTCNLKAFKDTLERIKNEDNTFTILNGDLCNIALKNSVSNVYENKSPMEEVEELIDYLEPIKDKILVISNGNHEERIKKDTSIDILWLVAKQLGIEERYAPSWWYLYLSFGMCNKHRPMTYTITGYHGAGSSTTTGAKINRAKKMGQVVVADIYLMSHVHEPINTKGIIFTPDYQHKSIVKREMYYCISNAYLEYEDSYAERIGMLPSNTGINEIRLNGRKKEIKLIL